jgi:hypothetical protein
MGSKCKEMMNKKKGWQKLVIRSPDRRAKTKAVRKSVSAKAERKYKNNLFISDFCERMKSVE